MKIINFSKFFKLLTSQPYFVWHNIDLDDEKEAEDLQFNLDSFKDIAKTSYSEIQSKSYAKIEKIFFEKIKITFPKIQFLKNKKIEDKIIETKNLILNPNVEVIFQPTFNYHYKNYDAISRPEIYDKKNKILYFLKFSTSTKLKDILRMYFEYQVVLKNNIDVQDIKLFILATKDYKKGEIDFFLTNKINMTKSGRSYKDGKWDFINKQIFVAGLATNKKGILFEQKTIFENLRDSFINLPSKKFFYFKDLNFYLEEIIESKKNDKIVQPMESDLSIFDNNKNWNYILKKTNNSWLGFSGHLVSKEDVVLKNDKHKMMIKNPTLKYFLKHKKPNIRNHDIKIVNKTIEMLEKKVVWFDFEAFSLPYAPIDHVLPFCQVVSQFSMIITNNSQEIFKHNEVFDTLHFTINNFEKIINSIYKKNHYFVVYSKSYELSRLDEMIYLLKKSNYPNCKILEQKVDYIKKNIIDLLDFFECYKNRKPIILIPELKGKYSIKFIEKYVSSQKPHLKYLIKEYKTLDIQNGMMAMDKANNRALGIIKDSKWLEVQEQLKIYCENDVRAMILVFHLMKELVEEHNGQ